MVKAIMLFFVAQILLQKWRNKSAVGCFCSELTVISWAHVKLFLKI